MANTARQKSELRRTMRARRQRFVAALPASISSLVFSRPPGPIAGLFDAADMIGLYHPLGSEARTRGYANYCLDRGMALALPWFAARDAPMQFRKWDGMDETLEPSAFGFLQPGISMPLAEPDLLIMPLVAFDAARNRLGQGAGHYDRYCTEHPDARLIGLAWSVQQVDAVPVERHDVPLDAIVTEVQVLMRDTGETI